MPVYMIRAGEHGPVKIGFAEDVQLRLVKMQADNHETLRVLRVFVGGWQEEQQLHIRFLRQRLHGEWFSFSVDMLGDLGIEESAIPVTVSAREGQTQKALIEISEDTVGVGFGARLRTARLAAGLTQIELGQASGVLHSNISRYEAGETLPSGVRLMNIARTLGVALDWLLVSTSKAEAAA